MKIDDDLPIEVISAVAKGCGFQVAYSREPEVDEWTLSSGHGETHAQYVGTRRSICGFLAGYAAMREKTIRLVTDLGDRHRESVNDALIRLRALTG